MNEELIPAEVYFLNKGIPEKIVLDENRQIKREDYTVIASAVMLLNARKYQHAYILSPENYKRITGGDE